MESIEEAIVRSDGSVKIRYYYGRTIIIPKEVIDKYGVDCWECGNNIIKHTFKKGTWQKEERKTNGRV